MAAIDMVNEKDSQALDGQSVTVTLSGPSADTYLPQLLVGQECVNESAKKGIVYSIDSPGNSFKVIPIQPDKNFDTNGTGYLLAGETITVTI